MATNHFLHLNIQSLQSRSEKIISIEQKKNLRDALKRIIESNLFAIIVNDSHGKCLGLISLRSCVGFILELFCEVAKVKGKSKDEILKGLSSHKFSADDIKKITKKFDNEPLQKHIDIPFVPIPQTATVKDLIVHLSTNEKALVVDQTGHIVDILSQAVIVEYLAKHLDQIGHLGEKTVGELNIFSSPVQTVSDDSSPLIGYAVMISSNFSSIGFMDELHEICGVMSFKDIKGAVGDFGGLVNSRIDDFVNEIRRSDTENILKDTVPTVNCKTSDPLGRVIAKLAAVGVHRLFVRDPEEQGHHFKGIITLSSVLRSLLM